MPITIEASTSAAVAGAFEADTSATIQQELIEVEIGSRQSGELEQSGLLRITSLSLDAETGSAISENPERNLIFNQIEIFTDYFYNFVSVEEFLDQDVFLRVTTGSGLAFLSDIVGYAVVNTYWPFESMPTYHPLNVIQKEADYEGVLIVEPNEEVSATGSLTLVDIIGPVIQNEIPLAGSVLNDPDTEITFDLVDAAIGVNESSVDLYINGYQVVIGGAALSPSGFGTTTFTKVSDNLYQLRFVKDTPFDFHETVTISGYAEDLEIPANSGIFLYSFRIWDEAYLGATITGTADIAAPYIANTLPFNGQIQVDPNINIVLEIHDLHTGVNPDSVTIEVEGNTVVESGVIVTDFANTTISAVPLERGYKYDIDPIETLPFYEYINIEVYAEDNFVRFDAPNILDTSYSFLTVNNQHLVISGLEALISGVYEPLLVETSLPSDAPTQFRIVYTDLSGSGIDVSNSYVYNNDVQISGVVFTEVVSGSNTSYYVEFDVEPYYLGETELLFTATQVFSGAVSGTIAPFRDYQATLRWGYQICYHPEKAYPYDTDIDYCVMIYDQGYWPSIGSHCSSFTTTLQSGQNLYAQIRGVAIDPRTQLRASYTPLSTFFEYGKTMELELEVEDYNGNKLTFPWTFTIEDKEE